MANLFEHFDTSDGWQSTFRTEFLNPSEIAEGKNPDDYGSFAVVNHQGVLTAFQQNTRGCYFSGPKDLDFDDGFTLACQCQRTQWNGGMTEFEIGVHEFGPFIHFEWSQHALWYYLVSGGQLGKSRQAVPFFTPSPRLALQFVVAPTTVIATAVDRDSERVLLHRQDDLDWSVFGSQRENMHFNFVATANEHTTKEAPVALATDYVYLGPPLASQQALRSVQAFGWMRPGAA